MRLVWILLAFCSQTLFAQAWEFKPKIYSRNGYTLNPSFDKRGKNDKDTLEKSYNFGPWQSESNIFAPALTEVTLEAAFGEEFRFYYGFDTLNSDRFTSGNTTALTERVAYLQYFRGDASFWFGSRPYRSEAEYLTRTYSFDEKNLNGGGVRFEAVGPLNVEFAYGIQESNVSQNGATLTNVIINKVEYPLSNGILRTNLEIQQHKRASTQPGETDSTSGWMLGLAYKRWGDNVLGGNLYNQLIVQQSKGFIDKHFMGSVFSYDTQNPYDDDYDAGKTLFQWNGDWKAERVGLYWANFLQMHTGKNTNGQFEDSELRWTTLDSFVRPQYGLFDNITVGGEYARRQILKEGEAVPVWAQNQGGWHWAFMLNYNLSYQFFNNPVVSMFVGEIHKDRAAQFYLGEANRNTAKFIRLNYEININ